MYRLSIPAAPEDLATARVFYRTAADAGVGEAMQTLGSMAEGAEGIAQPDDAEAARWFQEAAAAEHPEGMADWAFCLEQGTQVSRVSLLAQETGRGYVQEIGRWEGWNVLLRTWVVGVLN